jgi:hypothetical protein
LINSHLQPYTIPPNIPQELFIATFFIGTADLSDFPLGGRREDDDEVILGAQLQHQRYYIL